MPTSFAIPGSMAPIGMGRSGWAVLSTSPSRLSLKALPPQTYRTTATAVITTSCILSATPVPAAATADRTIASMPTATSPGLKILM